jgi:hypothetical protein
MNCWWQSQKGKVWASGPECPKHREMQYLLATGEGKKIQRQASQCKIFAKISRGKVGHDSAYLSIIPATQEAEEGGSQFETVSKSMTLSEK